MWKIFLKFFSSTGYGDWIQKYHGVPFLMREPQNVHFAIMSFWLCSLLKKTSPLESFKINIVLTYFSPFLATYIPDFYKFSIPLLPSPPSSNNVSNKGKRHEKNNTFNLTWLELIILETALRKFHFRGWMKFEGGSIWLYKSWVSVAKISFARKDFYFLNLVSSSNECQ